jgi:hypothetical protein
VLEEDHTRAFDSASHTYPAVTEEAFQEHRSLPVLAHTRRVKCVL